MGDITLETNLKAILGPGFQDKPEGQTAITEDAKTFSKTLAESLGKVNDLQQEADDAIEGLVSGKSQNIHETMIAVGKADIAFRMTMQVRNKIVEAYQEVLRMQV